MFVAACIVDTSYAAQKCCIYQDPLIVVSVQEIGASRTKRVVIGGSPSSHVFEMRHRYTAVLGLVVANYGIFFSPSSCQEPFYLVSDFRIFSISRFNNFKTRLVSPPVDHFDHRGNRFCQPTAVMA